MNRFAAREIEFAGTRTLHGWTVKMYGVHLPEVPVDWASFDRALDLAAAALPAPEPDIGRPGLGIFIAHQGVTGDYGVLGWWNHENELPFHIMGRRGPSGPWRKAVEGESVWSRPRSRGIPATSARTFRTRCQGIAGAQEVRPTARRLVEPFRSRSSAPDCPSVARVVGPAVD